MNTKRKFDFKLLIIIFILAIISIITIYCAAPYTSSSMGNLPFKQFVWYLIGLTVLFCITKYNNEFIYRHAWFLYILGNFLLLGLFFFGSEFNNSKCWYSIPGIGSFQPSEFMKIFLMLILGKLIHDFRNNYKNPSLIDEFIFLLKSLGIVLIPSILTFMQPDTGVVIIYFIIYIFMLFVSGIRIRWFVIGFIILGLISTSIFVLYFFKENLFIKLFGSSIYYRLERIFNWKTGSGLQLENALTAIGSAGLFGHGFNKTPIYFPEASTDFIFAVYASNFGFVGAILLIILLVLFDIRIINLARKQINDTDKFIISGTTGMLIFQQIQNIGMTIGLLPITGITLPFISYGGSSLISYMILMGIILNISKQNTKHYFYK